MWDLVNVYSPLHLPRKVTKNRPLNHIRSSTSHQMCKYEKYSFLSRLKSTCVRKTCNVMFPWLQLLEEGERVTISGNRVQVRELDRADGGVYTCTFKNIVGQVSHIIKLVIEGKKTITTPYTLSASVLSPFTPIESERESKNFLWCLKFFSLISFACYWISFAFTFAFARCEQARILCSLFARLLLTVLCIGILIVRY